MVSYPTSAFPLSFDDLQMALPSLVTIIAIKGVGNIPTRSLMFVNDRTEVSESHSLPYCPDRKSFLKVDLISDLSPFGEQFPELLGDESLLSE